jgi:glycosyltransferase involved in cell wall biosynthesis
MSNDIPLVSIITPSFNQGEFIEETILSVLNQDYENIEYIIIDGGSTDNTLEILERYSNKIDYWISEPDKGQSEAINKGFSIAKGEILNWLCSDDKLEKHAISKVVQVFKKNRDIEVVHGKSVTILPTGKQLLNEGHSDGFPFNYLSGMAFPQPSAFFRSSSYDEFGPINEKYHYAMDYDLYVKIALTKEFYYLDEVLSYYRLHETSKTTTSKSKFLDEILVIYNVVIQSLKSKYTIKELQNLGLYCNSESIFKVTKFFDDIHIKKSFVWFLYFRINWSSSRKEKVKLITEIFKVDRSFFIQRKLWKDYIKSFMGYE